MSDERSLTQQQSREASLMRSGSRGLAQQKSREASPMRSGSRGLAQQKSREASPMRSESRGLAQKKSREASPMRSESRGLASQKSSEASPMRSGSNRTLTQQQSREASRMKSGSGSMELAREPSESSESQDRAYGERSGNLRGESVEDSRPPPPKVKSMRSQVSFPSGAQPPQSGMPQSQVNIPVQTSTTSAPYVTGQSMRQPVVVASPYRFMLNNQGIVTHWIWPLVVSCFILGASFGVTNSWVGTLTSTLMVVGLVSGCQHAIATAVLSLLSMVLALYSFRWHWTDLALTTRKVVNPHEHPGHNDTAKHLMENYAINWTQVRKILENVSRSSGVFREMVGNVIGLCIVPFILIFALIATVLAIRANYKRHRYG